MNMRWKALIGLFVAATMVGCSGDSGHVKTAACTGTVTYKGAPVEGAIVTFNPSDKSLKPAVGRTDAAGKYTLTTFEAGDGAIPGSYKVSVLKIDTSKLAMKDTQNFAPGSQEALDAQYAAAESAGQDAMSGGANPGSKKSTTTSGQATRDMLPLRYKDPEASGLIANVTDGGTNNFDFPLED